MAEGNTTIRRKKERQKSEGWVRRSTRGCTEFELIGDNFLSDVGALQSSDTSTRDCDGKEGHHTEKLVVSEGANSQQGRSDDARNIRANDPIPLPGEPQLQMKKMESSSKTEPEVCLSFSSNKSSDNANYTTMSNNQSKSSETILMQSKKENSRVMTSYDKSLNEKSEKVIKKRGRPRKSEAGIKFEIHKDLNKEIESTKVQTKGFDVTSSESARGGKLESYEDTLSQDAAPQDHETTSTELESAQSIHRDKEITRISEKGTKKRGRPRKSPFGLKSALKTELVEGVGSQGHGATSAESKGLQCTENQVKTQGTSEGIVKKRGRPKKTSYGNVLDAEYVKDTGVQGIKGPVENDESLLAQDNKAKDQKTIQKAVQKRGRPKKVQNDNDILNLKPSSSHVILSLDGSSNCQGEQKKRGRKRKLLVDSHVVLSSASDSTGKSMVESTSSEQKTDPSHAKHSPKVVKNRKQQRKAPSDIDVTLKKKTEDMSEYASNPFQAKHQEEEESSSLMVTSETGLEAGSSNESQEECSPSHVCKNGSKTALKDTITQVKNKRGRPAKKKTKVFHNERLSHWLEEFSKGIFKCNGSDCTEEFNTWFGLFRHSKDNSLHVKEFPLERTELPCHVCKELFFGGPVFKKHMRVIHKDIYDFATMLDAGELVSCFNYTCHQQLHSYNECLEHFFRCGSLVKCEKCEKTYKTRSYFLKHSCSAETKGGDRGEKVKKVKQDVQATEIGPRQSARKALNAISRLDLAEENSRHSRKAAKEVDFEAGSSESDDSIEFEADVDDGPEDQSQDGDNQDLEINDVQLPCGNTFSSSSRISLDLSNRRVKPLKQNTAWLKEWCRTNHTDWLYPEFDVYSRAVSCISESDAKSYFPSRANSPLFNIVYETATQHARTTNLTQLEIFQSLPPLEGSKISNFFAGGLILAMEWCPTDGNSDQYLAVTACEGSEKNLVRDDESPKKCLIQIWKISNCEEKSVEQAQFVLGICTDYGPVHCLQWCPSGSFKQNDAANFRRLGILAASGVDGRIRIHSAPHPEDCLTTRPSDNKADDNVGLESSKRVFIKPNPDLVLAVSRSSSKRLPASSVITCLQWQPTIGNRKIAAGFQDGSLCIWDLTSRSTLLRYSSKEDNADCLLPFSRINAHFCSINSLSWCPGDENFIMTVSFEKFLKVFDIRNRHSVPEISIKRSMFEKCEFMRRLACFVMTENDVFNCVPTGSRYVDLVTCTKQRSMLQTSDLITSHNASCQGLSLSDWINGFATSCTAGEVIFRAYAHESHGRAGNSLRVPVYRIERQTQSKENEPVSPFVNEATPVTKGPERQRLGLPFSSAKEVIAKQIAKLESEVMGNTFTFRDSNFFEFRNFPHKCGADMDRLRCAREMEMSAIDEQELRQITQVQWNPNYGSHQMLASGGLLGIVRVHHFTKWM